MAITLSSNRKKKIKALIKLMNQQNERPFPAVSGLVKMLNLVLRDDELDYLLSWDTEEKTHAEAASISNVPKDQFESMFETLLEKGFIKTNYTENREERHSINAIAVGWLEANVPYLIGKKEEKEFAQHFYEFMESTKKLNFFPLRNLLNSLVRRSITNQSIGINEQAVTKIIEVNQQLPEPETIVYPTQTIKDLILEYGKKNQAAALPCMCRRMMHVIDQSCRFNMTKGCIGFGDMAKPFVKYGYAQYLTVEEAIDHIEEVREQGAIHSVFHERDDVNLPIVGICNCCWDCCGFFSSYNRGFGPLKYSCYYAARIRDISACTGCGKCRKYCPTTAAKIENETVQLNHKLCIGCGQCVFQCEQNVLELIPNTRDVFLPMLKRSEVRIIP